MNPTHSKKYRRRAFGTILLRGRNWYIRIRHKGRQIMRAVGPSRSMAEAKLAQLHVATLKKERLGILEPEKVTFSGLWPVVEPLLRARLAPSSYATDRSRYRVIESYFGTRPVCDIRSMDIEDFIAWMRNDRVHKGRTARGATTNRYIALLSGVLREAVRREYAVANPVIGIQRAREEQRATPYLSRNDIDRIITTSPPALRPLIAVAADTGLRRGELLALEWRDIDLGRGVLTVRHSKSKRPRDVPFTARARATLMDLHTERKETKAGSPDYVFADIANLAPSWAKTLVASRFRKAARAAGFADLTFHGLRHGYCSRLVQAGVPLGTVKALAGHGSLAVTNRYASHIPHGAEVEAIRRLETTEQTAVAGEAKP